MRPLARAGRSGSGIWYDLAPHLLDRGRESVWAAGEHDGRSGPAQARRADHRLLHAVLSYPQRRIVLHGTMVAAAESARYIIHGTRGSYVKFGLDPQEDRLKR